ncbi:MAG: hypothetical protein JJU03_13895 [Idiomarina sp.]|nr:hypothetical protein [Idiomarina sp.]
MSPPNRPDAYRHRTRLALLVLITWLGLSSIAMYYFVFADYGEFDPEQQWLGWQPPADLGAKLSLADDNRQWSIVHVRSEGCSCNSYLTTHLQDLTREHSGVDQIDASIDTLNEYGFVVPAAPMAMIFQGQHLVYAGPYASGPFCASEDSLINDLLDQRTQLAGTYLQGLVKACRCLI